VARADGHAVGVVEFGALELDGESGHGLHTDQVEENLEKVGSEKWV
jgi:hypothetical protein